MASKSPLPSARPYFWSPKRAVPAGDEEHDPEDERHEAREEDGALSTTRVGHHLHHVAEFVVENKIHRDRPQSGHEDRRSNEAPESQREPEPAAGECLRAEALHGALVPALERFEVVGADLQQDQK